MGQKLAERRAKVKADESSPFDYTALALKRTLYYLVTEKHTYTTELFQQDTIHPVLRHFVRVTYREWLQRPLPERPLDLYLFSDIERMTMAHARVLVPRWKILADRGAFLLNHPLHSMRRFELLQALQKTGQNKFCAYRLKDFQEPQQWPVFLRERHDHRIYSEGELLGSHEALAGAVEKLTAAGKILEDKLVIEFCNTADQNGIFRKFAAFYVGGIVIPRHIFFSKSWLQRYADLKEEAFLEEERHYLQTNPHQEQIKTIFERAQISYGRIDYSLLGDQIQVWEINTNPNILPPEYAKDLARLHLHQRFAAQLADAFALLLKR